MFGSSLLIASLPLLASSVWAAPAPASVDPLSLIKRAEGHEVVSLFSKRQSTYPPSLQIPAESTIPKAWLDKLAALNLPSNIPVATGTPLPSYGSRANGDPDICSFTYGCRGSEDLYSPPAGQIAVTFDDGVSGGSDELTAFLQQSNAMGAATHFMIGSYIVSDQSRFRNVANAGGHIGVHTWSHNYMTTLTNTQIVGELGWTMQLMSDLNGGRVPRFWRPPFGDVDNRVRAIAKGVFGLETVVWNQNTGDWNLDQNGTSYTVTSIGNQYTTWLADKSQGLMVLEHEIRTSQIQVFKNWYPRAVQMGWKVGNVADIWGKPWYQNAQNQNSQVASMAVGAGAVSMGSASASSNRSSTSSSSSASSTSSSTSSIVSTTTTSSISSTSRSATTTPSQVNAAASPSVSRASGAGSTIGMNTWGMAIPALGLLYALV